MIEEARFPSPDGENLFHYIVGKLPDQKSDALVWCRSREGFFRACMALEEREVSDLYLVRTSTYLDIDDAAVEAELCHASVSQMFGKENADLPAGIKSVTRLGPSFGG